jgi:hypothetical protein
MQTEPHKAYQILRIRKLERSPDGFSAALVRVGGNSRVLVFFPIDKSGWWTRFYDAELTEARPSTTVPVAHQH